MLPHYSSQSAAITQASAGAPLPPRHWFLDLLPPASVPLWALLFLLLPVALLTGGSLVLPLIEQGLNLATSGELTVSWVYLAKLITFLLLAVLGIGLLSSRLHVIYMTRWSCLYPKPHRLHVAYSANPRESASALLRWQGFRWLRVVVPPLLCIGLAFLAGLGALALFNHWSALSGLSSIFMFLVVFLLSLLGVATFLLIINSIWVGFTSLYGLCAAITEPDLSALQVYQRVNRIAFCSSWTWWLMPLYAITYFFIAGLAGWFLWSYGIDDLLYGRINWLPVIGFELAMMALLIGMNYARWLSYHRALIAYYEKLPDFIKDQFSEPD